MSADASLSPGLPDAPEGPPPEAPTVPEGVADDVSAAARLLADQRDGKRRRKGIKQPSQDEVGERLSYVVRLLARKAYKWEIKKLLAARYAMKARTCEKYLSRARAILRKHTGMPLERHREDAYGFWVSIIRDPEAGLREKMEAQREIQSLLGVNAAKKLEVTGKDGGALEQVVVYLPANGRESAAPVPPLEEAPGGELVL